MCYWYFGLYSVEHNPPPPPPPTPLSKSGVQSLAVHIGDILLSVRASKYVYGEVLDKGEISSF